MVFLLLGGWAISSLSSAASPAALDHRLIERIAIHRLNDTVWVPLTSSHKATQFSPQIDTLLLQINTQSPAQLEVHLCTEDKRQCRAVPTSGRLYSRTFTQHNLHQPLWLAVRATAWRGAYPPVFIRAELTLWAKEN